MADDKFSIKLDLDTNDANKKLKQVKDSAKDTGQEIEKEHKLKVDDSQASKSLDNIINRLDDVESKTKETGDAMTSMLSVGKITAFIGSIVAMGYALKKVYDVTSDTAHEIVNMSNKASSMFMNTNNLKAWETSFKAIGLSAQEADNTLSHINDTIINQMFNPDARTAALYARMGIQMRDEHGKPYTPEQVSQQGMKFVKQSDPYTAQFLGRQFGFSSEAIAAIRSGKDFNKILQSQKAKPVITTKEEQQASDFVKKQADFGSSLDMIKNQTLMPLASTINDKVIPSLNKFALELNKTVGESLNKQNNVYDNLADAAMGGTMETQVKGFSGLMTKASDWMATRLHLNGSWLDSLRLRLGMPLSNLPSNERQLMDAVISKESGYRNIPSSTLATKGPRKGQPLAYGIAQFKPETLQGYLGAGANPMDVTDTIKGLHEEIKDFRNLAAQKNFTVTPENFSMYHHLGKGNYLKGAAAQKRGTKTLGDVYDLLSPSGLMKKQNQGISNAILPDMMPQANQSATISNAITNNKTVNNVSTAHITGVTVQANDVQGLSQSLLNSAQKLDMTNAMYGNL